MYGCSILYSDDKYREEYIGVMTPEEKRKYTRVQDEGMQLKKKQMKKQRNRVRHRVKIFICVGMLGIVGLCSFALGKKVGAKESEKMIQVSVEEEAVYQKVNGEAEIPYGAMTIPEDELEKHGDGILLVNKNTPLPEDYEVELLTLPDGVNRAAKEAYEPLCNMLKAGRKEGLNFEICSSYRDVAYQKALFDEDVEELMREGYSYTKAYEKVAKQTMPPGCSEHSTGLAFDIVALDYQMLDAEQEKTAENKWLQEHCAEYGFILRYPKGKEDITSISYESWHFRYVGEEAAEYIMENGITLEEFLQN